jgi:hypothetical protein
VLYASGPVVHVVRFSVVTRRKVSNLLNNAMYADPHERIQTYFIGVDPRAFRKAYPVPNGSYNDYIVLPRRRRTRGGPVNLFPRRCPHA